MLISSSGETADIVESLKLVQGSPNGSAVLSLGVVNEAESTLARSCDAFIDVVGGQETCVATTKVFSATIMALFFIAVALGEECGTLAETDKTALLSSLKELPEHVKKILDEGAGPWLKQGEVPKSLAIGTCPLWDIACMNVLANNFIFLGRGVNFPIALEGAMKVKEIAYIHAEGYPAAEMKHGPIALIDQFMPVVFIAPQSDPTFEKVKANIQEVKTRSGAIIVITDFENGELKDLCEHIIIVPTTHEYIMPLLTIVPLQLLAYMMGVLRGNEVDMPRGLRKTWEEGEAVVDGKATNPA